MTKNQMNKIVVPVLAVLLINQCITGAFGRSLPYWAFDLLHRKGAWVLLAAGAIHAVLNWGWVKANLFKTP